MNAREDVTLKYSERPIVQFFLLFQDNPQAVIFLISLLSACIIVTVALYVINVTYIMISVLQQKADWNLILNTFISTLIIVITFLLVKYFKADNFVRSGILDTLFVMRNKGIKKGNIEMANDMPNQQLNIREEVFTVVNILGQSKALLLGNEPLPRPENRINLFELSTLAYPFYVSREDAEEYRRNVGKEYGIMDFVYVFTGSCNSKDCKLYRFSVETIYAVQLWNYLKKVTSTSSEKLGHLFPLWTEDRTSDQQDSLIEKSLLKTGDSGIHDCQDANIYRSEYSLSIDKGVWQCTNGARKDSCYVYMMIQTTESLKDVVAKQDCAENIYLLYRVAQYIQKLHQQNIVHGNITMRNILLFKDPGLMSREIHIFISTEFFFFLSEQIKGDVDHARKRRKFFDAEQRDNFTNVEKSTDVFAFGLCIIELMCDLTEDQKAKITKSIRSDQVYQVLDNFDQFNSCRYYFEEILKKIFNPRATRATIAEVLEHMENNAFCKDYLKK